MCVCVLTGRRFVRECIRGLKCRSVEAVHSPAHHACKPQGSTLLSREREKLQPLTAALPSLSQIADSPCPSLISVFRALSSVFFAVIIILYHSRWLFLYCCFTLSHFLSLSHILTHTVMHFPFLSRADLCSFSLLWFFLFILPCFLFSAPFRFYSSEIVLKENCNYIYHVFHRRWLCNVQITYVKKDFTVELPIHFIFVFL